MNSNSKIYKDPCYKDPCHKEHDDDCEPSRKCCRKMENQKFVLLKVGNATATAIPAITLPAAAGTITSFTVASLTIDTNNLDDPTIKIDFTSNLSFPLGIVAGTLLTFQVNKTFINQFNPAITTTVGPAFIYTTLTSAAVGVSDAFTFFVKDDDDFSCGLVRYTVVVTVGGVSLSVAASINNATLAVIIAAEED